MTELNSSINDLLAQNNSARIGHASYSLDAIDDFLKEAYQINRRASELLGYLRSIRQPYLSTTAPSRRKQLQLNESRPSNGGQPQYLTDRQRDQIDAEAKSVLRDLHAAVNSLTQAEQVRQEAEIAIAQKRRRRHGFGILGDWAAGGGAVSKSEEELVEDAKANTIKLHREGVIWFLQRKLEECGTAQSSMMEIRISRELEKSKSALYKTRGLGNSMSRNELTNTRLGEFSGGTDVRATSKSTFLPEEIDNVNTMTESLDNEETSLFAQENHDMIKYYENKLDQVRTAEKSLVEISELQSTLAGNLEIQSAQIDQLVQDSQSATENVGGGNKELKKASERKSTAKAMFYGTVGLCSVLIIWDLII